MSSRQNLCQYIENPSHSLMIFKDEHVVLVQDAYSKSVCHYLVLPVEEAVTYVHPMLALQSAEVRKNIQPGVAAAQKLAADTFMARGYLEDTEHARIAFVRSFIITGVHSSPSMANLHIHVLTKDMCLP